MLNDRPVGLLPPLCLVRVRGMVQDVKDPEYYAVAFTEQDEVRRTTVRITSKLSDEIVTSYSLFQVNLTHVTR